MIRLVDRLGSLATLVACAIIGSSPPSTIGAEDRDPKAGVFATLLAGEWRGTLEYRDYSNDKRVTLPTTLDARAAEDGRSVALIFRYDEGKGRTEQARDTFRIDPKGTTFTWESDGGKQKSEYALAGLDGFAERRRGDLMLTGTGVEDDIKVDVRQTITLEGDDLKIIKETRKPGETFLFRNAYKLRRASAARSAPSPKA